MIFFITGKDPIKAHAIMQWHDWKWIYEELSEDEIISKDSNPICVITVTERKTTELTFDSFRMFFNNVKNWSKKKKEFIVILTKNGLMENAWRIDINIKHGVEKNKDDVEYCMNDVRIISYGNYKNIIGTSCEMAKCYLPRWI